MRKAAIDAAAAAGVLIREGFGRHQEVDGRPAHDLKLSLDRQCEEKIIGVIRRSFPDHAVLSEEKGYEPGREPYVWIVDPLDGTVNFFHGLPHFCTSIACHELDPQGNGSTSSLPDGRRIGEACVGVVLDPMHDELFVGTGDGQATVNGRPLTIAPVADLAEAIVVVSFGVRDDSIPYMTKLLPRLTEEARKVRSLGSTALDVAQVAAGRIGAFIQRGTNLWDFAGAAAVVRAAGGIVDAQEFAPGRWRIIACNPGLYPRIKELAAL
jgi:fructose-1,6-bisphosphatase/inositol monophosphatase family enzyme